MAEEAAEKNGEFADFQAFWPFYLSEHMNPINRFWHFLGITTGLAITVAAFALGKWYLAPLGMVPGYLFAWVGHFGFEKNIPASFNLPWLSLWGDLYMYWRTLTLQISKDYERHATEIARFRERASTRVEEATAGS